MGAEIFKTYLLKSLTFTAKSKDLHKTHTDTAVVILSYNGRQLHKQYLPLIVSESIGRYDVILIDNASTDGTGQYVRENFPDIHLISLPENLGFTGGYMAGIQQIDSKYIVLLSADFEVTPSWFEPLHSLMENDTNIAACQPKVRYIKEREKFEYAGAAGGFIDTLGYPFCRGRIFFTLEEDQGQYDSTMECFWASGGCFFTRTALFKEFGGFDLNFFAHMEEIDLCWRYKNAGYKIMACGDSTVFHLGGSVISYGSPQKIYRNYRNGLIMMMKNMTRTELIFKLPLRIALDIIAAYKALFTGNAKEFGAIAKAHLHVFIGFGKWLNSRSDASKHIKHRNTKGIYKRSIVWDYFAFGCKTFDRLPEKFQ